MAGELHRCAVQSKSSQVTEQENEGLGKWERILQYKYDARVLDWKGNVNMSAHNNDRGPVDESLKLDFVRILNPHNSLTKMTLPKI